MRTFSALRTSRTAGGPETRCSPLIPPLCVVDFVRRFHQNLRLVDLFHDLGHNLLPVSYSVSCAFIRLAREVLGSFRCGGPGPSLQVIFPPFSTHIQLGSNGEESKYRPPSNSFCQMHAAYPRTIVEELFNLRVRWTENQTVCDSVVSWGRLVLRSPGKQNT